MQIENMSLEQILDFEASFKRRKSELAAERRSSDLVRIESLCNLHEYDETELSFLQHLFNGSSNKKGSTLPFKYYDPVSCALWTGNGSVKKEFKEAYEFDKANPAITPKRMDQYLIRDHEAKEIALKYKKDVRNISGDVIKYADLVAETASQPQAQVAA